MKKNKKNYVIILLVIILLALAVGYAVFSQTLTISGTATGSYSWDVHFSNATISGTAGDHGTITSQTATEIVVDGKLLCPGDGFTVDAEITNSGSLNAKLKELKVYAADGTTEFKSDDVEVLVPTIDGDVITANNGKCAVRVAVKWKDSSPATSVNASFKIKFTYEQELKPTNVTPSHVAH